MQFFFQVEFQFKYEIVTQNFFLDVCLYRELLEQLL